MGFALTQLFGSSARVSILALLLADPDREFYVREIERLARVQVHAVHVELRRLETLRLIESRRDGNRRYVQVVRDHPMYGPLKDLLLADAVLNHDLQPDLQPEAGGNGSSGESAQPGARLDPQHLSWLLTDICAVIHQLYGPHMQSAFLYGPCLQGKLAPDELAQLEEPVKVLVVVDELSQVEDYRDEILALTEELKDIYRVGVRLTTVQLDGTDGQTRAEINQIIGTGRRIFSG